MTSKTSQHQTEAMASADPTATKCSTPTAVEILKTAVVTFAAAHAMSILAMSFLPLSSIESTDRYLFALLILGNICVFVTGNVTIFTLSYPLAMAAPEHTAPQLAGVSTQALWMLFLYLTPWGLAFKKIVPVAPLFLSLWYWIGFALEWKLGWCHRVPAGVWGFTRRCWQSWFRSSVMSDSAPV
ncbi:hypothetical protein F4779DRAFT_583549 [Xylariaceae sp. FL0662B]|nr:hypothetical protein F4779DRAFT_583549 [Xylariaceae sp. FL0662B]